MEEGSTPSDGERFGSSAGGSVPEGAARLELLAQIVENSPVPIFIKDPAGVYLYANAAYVPGPPEDTIGKTDAQMYPASVAEGLRKHDLLAMRAPGPFESTQVFNVEGEDRFFRTVKFPIHGAAGEVLGVCGISLDITDTLSEQKARGEERQRAIDAKPFERLLASLTPQEARVTELLLLGFSDKQIAETLHLSEDTVRHHVSHMLKKLRKRSRTQAVIALMRNRRRE